MDAVPSSTNGLTRAAGRFVAELDFAHIPTSALATVEYGFADCVASMLASANEPAVRAVIDVVGEGGARESAVLLGSHRAGAGDAALINGTAAHAQDFDDIGLGSHPAHPSAVMVPAILALAEQAGASGPDMITAYVAGYEVWGNCARRDVDQHLERGWHATGVFGPIAAAAAAARILKLTPERAATALAIAASQSSGLLANFGSMTKPLHAGLAARAGVFSAQLAARGFTAGSESLEGQGGLLQAVSPKGNVDLGPEDRFSELWNIVEMPLGFKLYPVCYAMHRVVDAACLLHVELGLKVSDIEQIEVTVGSHQKRMLTYARPENDLQAKFSLAFGVAIGLIQGCLELCHLHPEFIESQAVRRMMDKVRVVEDSRSHDVYRIFSPHDVVEVILRNGSRHRQSVEFASGHPTRPLATAALQHKFMACVANAFAAGDAELCFESMRGLRSLSSISALPRSVF